MNERYQKIYCLKPNHAGYMILKSAPDRPINYACIGVENNVLSYINLRRNGELLLKFGSKEREEFMEKYFKNSRYDIPALQKDGYIEKIALAEIERVIF